MYSGAPLQLTNQPKVIAINPFSPSQLSTPNFSLHNTYKTILLVMRKWELIKQSKPLKIKSKTLSNLFNEKYELKLGEFNNAIGTERVKALVYSAWCYDLIHGGSKQGILILLRRKCFHSFFIKLDFRLFSDKGLDSLSWLSLERQSK